MNYTCSECQSRYNQWSGQCKTCLKWNTLEEEQAIKKDKRSLNYNGYAGDVSKVTPIGDIEISQQNRTSTLSKELDRVLGGGLVEGSVVLLGGDPGIGKSTLLTQTLANLSLNMNVLYVTGEESLQQVALRAKRLQLKYDNLMLLAETHIETIIETAKKHQPRVLVVDSIQTIFSDSLNATPGGVSQVKECAQLLVRFAKSTKITLFIVGHVTKEGALAGPRVLEHMVDTVLYFEGESDSRYRMIRAFKNRFGAVNELGLFAMTDKGLKDVSNPSAIFLTNDEKPMPGNVIMVTKEGTRPILVEVQALVDTAFGNPKRITAGLDNNRLSLLLAVLNRHGGISTFESDIFINIAGGVKIAETAIDVVLIMAIISSLKNITIPKDLVAFGEIGLGGEIRPVANGQERLNEAMQHGMQKAIIPKANCPRKKIDIKVYPIDNIQSLIELLLDESFN